MEEKYGFKKFTIDEFEQWIKKEKVGRTVLTIQQHHTWRPSYLHFDGTNHFRLQRGMQNTHVNELGWYDIGQHLTIFPDGIVMTGRSFEISPACIRYRNANAFCIENIGNFDGQDEMTAEQKESILRVTAVLLYKFGLRPNTNDIVYHHWFRMSDGHRNNGSDNIHINKTCPGKTFFNGHKVEDCETHFLPLVKAYYDEIAGHDAVKPLKYAAVASNILNVRVGPHFRNEKAGEPLKRGAVARVYEISENNWFKISSSEDRWVSGRFTYDVHRAEVLDADMYPSYAVGDMIFVETASNGWHQVNMTFDLIHESHLKIEELNPKKEEEENEDTTNEDNTDTNSDTENEDVSNEDNTDVNSDTENEDTTNEDNTDVNSDTENEDVSDEDNTDAPNDDSDKP